MTRFATGRSILSESIAPWASLLLMGAMSAQGATAPSTGTMLVQAKTLVVAPELVLTDSAVLVRDGKIAGVGDEIPAEAKRGVPMVQHKLVIAGFVCAHDHLATGNDLAERISAFTPDLLATDALDPFDRQARRWAEAGVTTIGYAPLSLSTFPGQIGVVGLSDGGLDAIAEAAQSSAALKVALVAESLDRERYPTSAMGAARLIRESFENAGNAELVGDDPAYAALREARSGRPTMIHARKHGEITRALDLCEELGIAPMLLGADEVERSLERLVKLRGSVILAPLSFQSRLPMLQLPGKLMAAGVPFSFSGSLTPRSTSTRRQLPAGLPPGFPIELLQGFGGGSRLGAPAPTDPRTLRRSVALAVRHGLSRTLAHAALTAIPAAQLGIKDRGTLRVGQRADLLAFDGDPVDMTTRLEQVYIAGQALESDDDSATEDNR